MAVEFALGGGFEQDVGAGDQLAQFRTVIFLLEIEHDRTFAAVVLPEKQRTLGIVFILIKGPDAARGAAAGRLYFDHFGAQSRQGQPAVLGLLVGQFNNADARK